MFNQRANNIVDYVDFEKLGLLEVSGPQNAQFLQGQLSCDINEVTLTQSRLGVHCNVQGKVLATFRVFYKDPYYYLLLPYNNLPFLLKDLSKYALFHKVVLTDKTHEFQKVGVVGPTIQKALAHYDFAFQLADNAVDTQQSVTCLSIPGVIPRVVLLSHHVPLSDTLPKRRAPFSKWEIVDINTGIVTIYPETRGLFTPHHINYHKKGGISFTKGCYIGQEIVARMHYLGKVKQKVYQFELNQLAIPGSDIVDEQQNAQGKLIMLAFCKEKTETAQALGLIQPEATKQALYCNGSLLKAVQQSNDD